ncbi:MAG TPA: nicotinamide-nucleotide amidohydrolase family protein, partial [Bryobacteraceae bacterium]|nr:nicotinamide-nucleotide amidohydrolase family protein [Bryobacteraceae bacterium]
ELECMPRLQAKLPAQVLRTRFFRVAGMPESEVDQLIAPVYTRYTNPACTILAAAGDIQVHLRARCATPEEAESLLDEVGSQIIALLGDRLYSRDGRPLEACIGSLLQEAGQSLCVAESCTGGLLAGRITEIPGSSNYFQGGFLTYTSEAKRQLLGVSSDLLDRHTAVSSQVAEAMAAGAREKLRSDYALSVTGIAGPDGGTDAIPVGTVFIGLADSQGVSSTRFQFMRDRTWVRTLAVNAALDLLRMRLLSRNQRQAS